jgi:diazepam-binding inhibitor (GABA receptor modulating acyl-CoA-binding protein)
MAAVLFLRVSSSDFCGGCGYDAPSPTNQSKETGMSLQEQFDQAQADSKNLAERPDNMTLLKIYALFKQASVGDATGERPGMTDFVGRAKFDAWDALKGKTQDEAKQMYIDLIEELK